MEYENRKLKKLLAFAQAQMTGLSHRHHAQLKRLRTENRVLRHQNTELQDDLAEAKQLNQYYYKENEVLRTERILGINQQIMEDNDLAHEEIAVLEEAQDTILAEKQQLEEALHLSEMEKKQTVKRLHASEVMTNSLQQTIRAQKDEFEVYEDALRLAIASQYEKGWVTMMKLHEVDGGRDVVEIAERVSEMVGESCSVLQAIYERHRGMNGGLRTQRWGREDGDSGCLVTR